jgi:uncharacterized membrane protein YcaP (DUF421 family)
VKKEEIHLWDIKRILFGQAPPEFLLEVFIRSLIIYIAAIVVFRLMGKRMNGQHTIVELSVMVMAGAIVAVPMQIPDRGILQGILVLLVTLVLLRSINWLGHKYSGIEKLIHGEVITLVRDGVLQKTEQLQTKITNQQLFEVLRSKKVYNLGKVKRLYLEACGIFSLYTEEEEKPGLSLLPPADQEMYETYPHTRQGYKACTSCGAVQKEAAAHCPHCSANHWSKAIL